MADNPIATAYVEVRPKTDNFQGDVQTQVAGTVQTIGQAFASVQIGQFLKGAIGEAEEARDIAAQTAAAIRSTGAAANVTEDDVGRLSERLSEMAAVDDDVIQKGANLLLTFTNIRNEVGEGNDIFNQATESLVDMAAALGTDAPSAAIQLGKALNDPVAGITALTRAGVSFTEQQKDQIGTLVESGELLEAQKIILEELERQFGGSAAAQASGLDRINVSVGNLKESIGGALAPLLESAVPLIEGFVDVFESAPGPIQATIVGLGGVAVAARPINEVITLFRTFTPVVTANTVAVQANAVATNSAVAVQNLYTGSTTRAAGATALFATALRAAAAAFAGYAIGAGVVAESRERALSAGEEEARQVAETINSMQTYQQFQDQVNASIGRYNDLVDDANSGADIFANDDIAQYTRALSPVLEQFQALDDVINAYAEHTGDADEATRLFSGRQEEAAALLNSGYTPAQAAAELAITARREAEADATAQTEAFGVETETTAEAAARLADEIADAVSNLRDYFGLQSSSSQAQIAFRDSLEEIAGMQEAVNDGTLTGQERVDDFATAILRGRDNILDYAEAQLEAGASVEDVIAQVQGMTDELFNQADQAGLTADEVNYLRSEYGLMPEQISTTLNSNLRQVADDIDLVNQRIREALLNSQAYGGITRQQILDTGLYTPEQLDAFGLAAGGIVPGYPGQPVPIIAHGGERIDGTWADHDQRGGVYVAPGAIVIQAPDSERAGRAAGRALQHAGGW
jgi:hypothetical protein